MALYEHDGSFGIFLDGKELMHSSVSTSEEALGRLGVEDLDPGQAANVLIGGLGLGFTLRAALRCAGPEVCIDVVELLPAVIEWNHTHMIGLNGFCLNDARVRIINSDITQWISTLPGSSYDAILLDVDNGPVAMVDPNNSQLYSMEGIGRLRQLLRPGGRLAIWSAGRDHGFQSRLKKVGISFEIVPAKVHRGARQNAIAIYLIQAARH